jgi:hypothetical protein
MKTFVLRLSVLAGAGALALALIPPAAAEPAAGTEAQAPGPAAAAGAQPMGVVGRSLPTKPTGAVTAQADLDGSCDTFPDQTGDVCLYHSAGGSLLDLWRAPCDLASFGFVFISPGDGQGASVFNNWAFAYDADPRLAVQFFSGPNCTNLVGVIQPGETFVTTPGLVVQGFQFVPTNSPF